MGKLINTSDLQQAFCCLDWASEHDLWTAQKAVDDAPEAIVRCGQCKSDDFYCADEERREDGEHTDSEQ